MKYLLDTDWVIGHFRNVERFSRRLEELTPEGLAISIISLAELYEGVYSSRDPEQSQGVLTRFLNRGLAILSIDEETARIFGSERSRLRHAGTMTGDLDLLIAATCLRHGLVLLTNNRRHFELITDLEIISV